MIEIKPTFIPLGTRVLLQFQEETKSKIELPDGVRRPGVAQRFLVVAVGPMVNKDGYSLKEGDVVQLSGMNSTQCGVDVDQKLFTIDRMEINVIVKNG